MADHAHAHDAHDAHGHHDDHHHVLPFWRHYLFSTDHKVIGVQYGLTGLAFLLFGFMLIMVMRWRIANPGQAVPIFGSRLQTVFGEAACSKDSLQRMGMLTADGYNSFGAMHGTIMV